MNASANRLALWVSYAILALSLIALAAEIAAYSLHIRYRPPMDSLVAFSSYLWPLAAYAIAAFRKQRDAAAGPR